MSDNHQDIKMTSRIVPVVLGVVYKDGKYLMTQRGDLNDNDSVFFGADKPWQIPGGELEFGEDPLVTLNRELMEEIGIEVENPKLVPKIFTEIRGRWQGLFITYICTMKNSEDQIKLNEESCDYKWVTLEEASALISFPGTLELLKVVDQLV